MVLAVFFPHQGGKSIVHSGIEMPNESSSNTVHYVSPH